MATEIRDAETANAQNNPSILSNLVGAGSSGGAMTSPPPGAGQAQNIAQNLSSNLYGGQYMTGVTNSRDAQLAELYNYDKQIEQNYNPLPSPSWYVQNPADASTALTQAAGTSASNVDATQRAADITERAYQTAVGGVLDRFTEFMKLQQDAKNQEEQLKLEREKLALQEKQGGGSGGSWGKGIAAMTAALAASGGKLDQNTLLATLANAGSSTEAQFMMQLAQQYGGGTGAMTDEQALYQVMQQPGGVEALGNVPAEMKASFARQMLASGGTIPKVLSTQQQTALTQLQALKDTYDRLVQEYGDIPSYSRGRVGGLMGNLSNTAGLNAELSQYDALRMASITPIARILSSETGPMSENDIKRAEGMLPSATSTPEEVYLKFTQLADMISTRIASLQGTPGLGQEYAGTPPAGLASRPPLSGFNTSNLSSTLGASTGNRPPLASFNIR